MPKRTFGVSHPLLIVKGMISVLFGVGIYAKFVFVLILYVLSADLTTKR